MRELKIWIDATDGKGRLRLYGMTLLERLLRSLREAGLDGVEIGIESSPGASAEELIPARLAAGFALTWTETEAVLAHRLERALGAAEGGPLLALGADSVADPRLLRHLAERSGSVAFVEPGSEGGAALLRLEAGSGDFDVQAEDLRSLALTAIRAGRVAEFAARDFDDYLVNLRRSLPPYLYRVGDAAARDRVERALFWSNYKGSTDFMTKYVYPPLVWLMVRPLSRWRVHPHWVTLVDIFAALAAIPLFAAGLWIPGLLCAYAMSVLDSVDGKLARLTFSSSKLGEILDHGLDIVHPPFWYMAWGWALGGGDAASPIFRATLWMLGFYVADRLCALVFKWRTGRSIHGYTPLDERLRTVVSRRNVNLPLFTVALVVDLSLPEPAAAEMALYAIVVWQVLSFVFHSERVVRFWGRTAQTAA